MLGSLGGAFSFKGLPVENNYDDIEFDMNTRNSTAKKQISPEKRTRKRREELSLLASKSIWIVILGILFLHLYYLLDYSDGEVAFLEIVKKLNFQPIRLKQNFNEAAELILLDKKHLDNNPKIVQKNDIIDLLKQLNESDGVSDL